MKLGDALVAVAAIAAATALVISGHGGWVIGVIIAAVIFLG